MKPTIRTLNSRRMVHPAISMILLITISVSCGLQTLSAQILEHGNFTASPSFTSSSSPQFHSSQNMAILKCIPTDTWCNGFDYFTEDGFHYIVMPADGGYRFHDVTDPSRPLVLGQIELPDGFFPRDAEIAYYGDTTRLFLVGIYRKTNSLDPHRPAVILDVVLTDNVSSVLLTQNGTIANTEYISYGVDVITPESGSNGSMIYNIEMLHRHDRMLFVASNTNALQYYSIAHHQLRDSLRIIVDPDSTGTLHKEVKIHEVKADTYQEGSRVVGLGTVRSGIRVLDFTSEWENPAITAQIYDFDRTIFPDTIINPYKYRWDTLSYSIVVSERIYTNRAVPQQRSLEQQLLQSPGSDNVCQGHLSTCTGHLATRSRLR